MKEFYKWTSKYFELSRGGSYNLSSMEGLRGFAVLLVFFVHYASLVKPYINLRTQNLNEYLHIVGNIGVDLFFVLSGYLIYGSLIKREQKFFHFLTRRIQRIYPAFSVVLIIYLALSLAFPNENKIPSEPLRATIYLIENFLLLPGIFPITPIITVAWSLSYEVFFYLFTPLLIVLFQLRRRTPQFRIIFIISLVALHVSYCAIYGGHIRLIMFVSGIILFETIDNSLLRHNKVILGYLSILLSFIVPVMPVNGNMGDIFRAVLLFLLFYEICYQCFVNPDSSFSKIYTWTPIRWLGNISYSYYLIHGVALKAAFLIFSKFHIYELDIISYLGLMSVMFALSIIPAILLYVFVEKPFSLKKRIS